MVEFRRIYGDRATLFGAIFAPLSRPNKLPLEPYLPDPRLCPHLCRCYPTTNVGGEGTPYLPVAAAS